MKSEFQGFPVGFDYFGPQIRIPREQPWYIVDGKRLDTPNFVNKYPNLVLKKTKTDHWVKPFQMHLTGQYRPFEDLKQVYL